MTAKQLKRKLKDVPDDAIVTIPNHDLYVAGDYVATGIEVYDDTVEIITDYEQRR